MSAVSDAFLAKARESLAGATSELANGRANNTANRAYYAAFQAAIAALDLAGIHPPTSTSEWSRSFVKSQFAGVLVNRRKLYPANLRDVLPQLAGLREVGDYRVMPVSARQASRSLTRAAALVGAAEARGGQA